jgi:hypothetical protein
LNRQHGHLEAGLHRSEAAFDERTRALGELLGRDTAGAVRIQLDAVMAAAAEQLVDGQSRDLPFDVPQRLLDRAHCGERDGAAAEERLPIHELPQVLDPRRVLADDVLRVFVDGGGDGERMSRQAPLTDAGHTFVRLDDDKEPVPRADVDDERFE